MEGLALVRAAAEHHNMIVVDILASSWLISKQNCTLTHDQT